MIAAEVVTSVATNHSFKPSSHRCGHYLVVGGAGRLNSSIGRHMQINVRFLKSLAVIGAGSSAMLFGSLILAMSAGSDRVSTPLFVFLSVSAFASLLLLWIYWLVFFYRTSQRREFWLCYCLPYLYSSYKTVAFLRKLPEDVA